MLSTLTQWQHCCSLLQPKGSTHVQPSRCLLMLTHQPPPVAPQILQYHEVMSHTKGEANQMADTPLSHQHDLTDDELLTLFDFELFLQEKPWHMCQLPTMMHLALNSSLHGRHPDVIALCLLLKPTEPISSCTVWLSAKISAMTLSCLKSPSTGTSISSSSLDADTIVASVPVVQSPSNLSKWQRPYMPWARSSHNWDLQI